MRRFRGCQLSWHLKLPNIYEGMIDANSGEAVRRLGRIIQSIFWASIRLTVWKWSGESRYPRTFPPVLKTFAAPLIFSRPDWRPLGLRGCDHTKFGFYQFQSFLFIVVIVILILFETTFSQISIHSQLLAKILQRFDKEKSTFKSIEKYDLWKTVSKHLKIKSIKMFTERLCDKGIGNVLNFRIEVSLGE